MYGAWFLFALRTLARLFSSSGPPLLLFWLMHPAGLAWPTPLAAALGLQLVLRFRGNLPNMWRSGREIPRAVYPFLLACPVLLLLSGDGVLMFGWSALTLGFAATLWWMPEMRAQEEVMRPSPIEDSDAWIDMRAWVLIAGAALGFALSLTKDPAIWITGTFLGVAAFDLTGLLYLRVRGHL